MKNSPSKIALMASIGLALAFTFSCSGGDDSSKDSCSAEIPFDLQRDINAAEDNAFSVPEPPPPVPPAPVAPQPQPEPPPPPYSLSKPSSSIVAESESAEDDVVVCKEIVEAEKNRIEKRIRDNCAKYPDTSWCTSQVIKYVSGIDLETGKPIEGMDKNRAIVEGRPLWILKSIKTR